MKTQTLVEVEFQDLGQKLTRLQLLPEKHGYQVVASSVLSGCKYLHARVIEPVTLKMGSYITLLPVDSNSPIKLPWRVVGLTGMED